MEALDEYFPKSGIDPKLLNLLWLRASQLNGCSYCIQLHSADLLSSGERAERLFQLDSWRESPAFTEKERVALAWTEAVTIVSLSRAPDYEFEALRAHFTEKEIVDLTWAIGVINLWNRMSISFRVPPRFSEGPAKS